MISVLFAALLAMNTLFGSPSSRPGVYVAITLTLPLLWGSTVRLCRGYVPKFTGVSSDDFRRVLNVGFCLTAVAAMASYVGT